MKILYVASECAPYIASGGLGDVIGALPKAVKKNNPDYTVQVALPLYKTVPKEYKDKLEPVSDISFNLAWRRTGASVFKLSFEGIDYYFFENHYYFDRDRIYGEYDDAERFAFFCLSVLEFVKTQNTPPDVIHANDWQTAPLVVYLKTKYKKDSQLSDIKTLYTIHNIEYQGKFASEILSDVLGLDEGYRNILEYGGCINLMKGALVLSDYINTVSPKYANELKYDFFAFGLADIIASVSDKMCGVINGIDYKSFSPEGGADIYKGYTSRTLDSGKKKNKLALQEELGLSTDETKPLIVMITRLTEGKGIDLVLHILDELLSLDIQMAILGTGEERYEKALSEAERGRENFRAIIKFDRAISRKMYAGADMFLMPSKSEPCGLAQMIACSYGTVPIVRSVGGLYDSIIPYGTTGANGFRFDDYNAHELLYTVKGAVALYQDAEKWKKLRRSAKASDFSWDSSAVKYISIYKKMQKR